MGNLGERLTDEMKRQSLTAAELSRRSGEEVANIRRIMNGEVTDPRLSTLANIARGLGRSIDYLVWEVGKDDPEMSKVIDFFTYQWPYLSGEDKTHINGLLGLMVAKKDTEKIWSDSSR
ncbi:MAG: helix-turn-helix transcriptional regulator [Dehalococcoidia bacterium]|jgi:transcriptional regulator with XRE-family HTH domain